jgi:hypothetical protein
VGAAGSDGLLRLSRGGRIVDRMPVDPETHLMDFTSEDGRARLYTSSCDERPAIQRIDLARHRQDTLTVGRVCGQPLAVHRDRFLVLAAPSPNKRGDPVLPGRPQRLLLVDLEAPGSARRIPRSGAPLDAVVVR